MKSAKYNKVKTYYEKGLWNVEMVMNAIGRWITDEEAHEILGEAYNAA